MTQTKTNGEITLPTNYQSFIHMSRYSRWLEDEQRRETWEETVDRYLSFMAQHLGDNYSYDLHGKELGELRDAMHAQGSWFSASTDDSWSRAQA